MARSTEEVARRSLLEPEHAWERQPGEPDTAWVAFVQYRDLGPAERSLARLAQVTNKKRELYGGWCGRWNWVARCAAYDAWLDRQTKLAEIDAIREMKRRHVQIAMTLQGAGALALNKIVAAEKALGPEGQPGPLTLKPAEAMGMVDLGSKLERLSRGEPDSIEVARIESAPALDYSLLSNDELRTMIALTRKASAVVPEDGDLDGDA